MCFNRCTERVMDNIEVIYDELKQNQIYIDKHECPIISHKQNSQSKQRSIFSNTYILDIEQLYREINITNFGRTIAYLACVYLQSEDEETVRLKTNLFLQTNTKLIWSASKGISLRCFSYL